jgi:hypothetical protein
MKIKWKKYILCIIFVTLAFIALVPIGSLVFAQSEDDEDEEQMTIAIIITRQK